MSNQERCRSKQVRRATTLTTHLPNFKIILDVSAPRCRGHQLQAHPAVATTSCRHTQLQPPQVLGAHSHSRHQLQAHPATSIHQLQAHPAVTASSCRRTQLQPPQVVGAPNCSRPSCMRTQLQPPPVVGAPSCSRHQFQACPAVATHQMQAHPAVAVTCCRHTHQQPPLVVGAPSYSRRQLQAHSTVAATSFRLSHLQPPSFVGAPSCSRCQLQPQSFLAAPSCNYSLWRTQLCRTQLCCTPLQIKDDRTHHDLYHFTLWIDCMWQISTGRYALYLGLLMEEPPAGLHSACSQTHLPRAPPQCANYSRQMIPTGFLYAPSLNDCSLRFILGVHNFLCHLGFLGIFKPSLPPVSPLRVLTPSKRRFALAVNLNNLQIQVPNPIGSSSCELTHGF